MYVDNMNDTERARATVDEFLQRGTQTPLRVVELTAALQQELDIQQRDAVRAAAEAHSWAEIGAALGVSRQAAHRKYVTAVADELKADYARMKRARKQGQPHEAAAALSSVLEASEVLRATRKP